MSVLGLGTAAMDVVLQCESLPREDGFAFVHRENLMSGGSCANTLVTLSCLGQKTSMVAKTGDDHYGKVFKEELIQSGVDTEHLYVKKGGVSLHTFITVDRKGRKAIYSNLGNSLLDLSEDEVDVSMVDDVNIFYTDMFPGKPALKLARLCQEKSIPVVFNLECAPDFMSLCHTSMAEIAEMMQLADVVFICREALFEMGESTAPLKAAENIFQKYKPLGGIIATQGESGVLWYDSEGQIRVPAFSVKAIDTTGAGDAFNGGFIYSYLIKKMSLDTSLRFASACAAIKCTQLGPRLKTTVEQVHDFMLNA